MSVSVLNSVKGNVDDVQHPMLVADSTNSFKSAWESLRGPCRDSTSAFVQCGSILLFAELKPSKREERTWSALESSHLDDATTTNCQHRLMHLRVKSQHASLTDCFLWMAKPTLARLHDETTQEILHHIMSIICNEHSTIGITLIGRDMNSQQKCSSLFLKCMARFHQDKHPTTRPLDIVLCECTLDTSELASSNGNDNKLTGIYTVTIPHLSLELCNFATDRSTAEYQDAIQHQLLPHGKPFLTDMNITMRQMNIVIPDVVTDRMLHLRLRRFELQSTHVDVSALLPLLRHNPDKIDRATSITVPLQHLSLDTCGFSRLEWNQIIQAIGAGCNYLKSLFLKEPSFDDSIPMLRSHLKTLLSNTKRPLETLYFLLEPRYADLAWFMDHDHHRRRVQQHHQHQNNNVNHHMFLSTTNDMERQRWTEVNLTNLIVQSSKLRKVQMLNALRDDDVWEFEIEPILNERKRSYQVQSMVSAIARHQYDNSNNESRQDMIKLTSYFLTNRNHFFRKHDGSTSFFQFVRSWNETFVEAWSSTAVTGCRDVRTGYMDPLQVK